MASVRSVMSTTPHQRAMALFPSLPFGGHRLAAAHTVPVCVLKYRPLRQPQFSRMASTTTTTSSSSSSPSTPVVTSRSLHSSTTKFQAGATATLNHSVANTVRELNPEPRSSQPTAPNTAAKAPLSILPLRTILRSLAVTTLSSSPFLLPPSLAVMGMLAHTTNPILNPDRNPLLRKLMKSTFYTQFCAGENAAEVRETMSRLRSLGFSGVILGYAREVVLTDDQMKNLTSNGLEVKALEESGRNEVVPWAQGTQETIRLAQEGDFVGIKFTGAGRQALWTLSQKLPPPAALADAMNEVCSLAASRGVRLLIDAEQQSLQAGIDDWSMQYMRKFNKPGRPALIYNTYQAYLKATPSILASHMRMAKEGGFPIGVKLVRGAYLGSDPRHLIHDTKADTDACYNGIAAALLRREWSGPLAPFVASVGGEDGSLPAVDMILASHNAESVRAARDILLEPGRREGTDVVFAQLQGMADEVSCEILSAKREAAEAGAAAMFKPRAYKYMVWGSTGDCMKYLLRRAHENRDAVQRTKNGRDAMKAEVLRRLKRFFGLA